MSPAAEEALTSYRWPGNVRELQNCIERAVILADGDTLLPRHLSLPDAPPSVLADTDPWERIDLSGTLADASGRVLAEVERRKIELALRQSGGDRGIASEKLGLPYKVLAAKLRQHGLE